MTASDYFAFGAMAVVFVAIIGLVIFLGDLPGRIAKEQDYPQVTAVTVMPWFGLLFTGGGIVWILAIIWAFFDYSARGIPVSNPELEAELKSLHARLTNLEASTGKT